MSPKLMIWASVVLSAGAQMFLKHGLSQLPKSEPHANDSFAVAWAVMGQRFVWTWAVSFAAATGLWLLGLQKLDLSYAYPLVAFGYVLVSLLSALLFNERVDGNRWAAVGVICLGVMLIAGS